MYVCLCNGVTDKAIQRAAQSGIRTMSELSMSTGCGAGCGCCGEVAEALLIEALNAHSTHSGFAAGLLTSA